MIFDIQIQNFVIILTYLKWLAMVSSTGPPFKYVDGSALPLFIS